MAVMSTMSTPEKNKVYASLRLKQRAISNSPKLCGRMRNGWLRIYRISIGRLLVSCLRDARLVGRAHGCMDVSDKALFCVPLISYNSLFVLVVAREVVYSLLSTKEKKTLAQGLCK